jgi:hypothetical protein
MTEAVTTESTETDDDVSKPADASTGAEKDHSGKPGGKASPPSKSLLLARLRARLSGKAPPGT